MRKSQKKGSLNLNLATREKEGEEGVNRKLWRSKSGGRTISPVYKGEQKTTGTRKVNYRPKRRERKGEV